MVSQRHYGKKMNDIEKSTKKRYEDSFRDPYLLEQLTSKQSINSPYVFPLMTNCNAKCFFCHNKINVFGGI